MLDAPVSLSHAAYEVLWERAGLGVMPAAVSITYPLRTPDDGARLARTAFAELRELDLAHDGEADPALLGTLRALARAPLRYYGLYLSAAHPAGSGSLIAVDGRRAVLAVLDTRGLHLHPMPATGAAATLAATLPAHPPGTGRSLSFRADELRADGRPVRPAAADGGVLTGVRAMPGDVHRYARLLMQPRSAMSYLYAVRDDRRCTHPLIALDLRDDGRWLTGRHTARNGIDWITATPATATTVTDALAELR